MDKEQTQDREDIPGDGEVLIMRSLGVVRAAVDVIQRYIKVVGIVQQNIRRDMRFAHFIPGDCRLAGFHNCRDFAL